MPVSKKRVKKVKSKTTNQRTLLRGKIRKLAINYYEGFNILKGNAAEITKIIEQTDGALSVRQREILKSTTDNLKFCTGKLEEADKELSEARELTKNGQPLKEWLLQHEIGVDGILVKWELELTDLASKIEESLLVLGELTNE